MGFALTLPSVTRRTSNGIPRYEGEDVFVLTGEGDLVPALDPDPLTNGWVPRTRVEPDGDSEWNVTVYLPRRESDFARIEQWTSRLDGRSHWSVRGRDNTVCRYGLTDNGRIFDPAHPDRIFQWLPEELEDPRGNRVRYVYKAENDVGVSPAIYEQGRDHRANRYISRIEYGNYVADGVERFSCRVLFDYGEYSVADPDGPPGDWIVRADPFSSYRSGFEIRTLRRCRAILVQHCFHDQFGGEPFLVRALELDYGPAPGQAGPDLSFVRRVTETGFRRLDDGGYLRAPYPPLELDYSPFEPRDGHYRRLVVERNGSLPGYLGQGQYLLTDLGGQGLPGLLYSDANATLFWEPLGGGRFTGPIRPSGFPLESDLNGGSVVLTSLRANGQQDLVVNSPRRPGCYPADGTGCWQPFRPFPSAPTDLGDPRTQLVDMTGAGRADIALLEKETIRTWPSLGLDGYGPAEQAPSRLDFPVSTGPDVHEMLTFADMFGDGLSHRVRIRDGEIECWPNLGYGRFGSKVTLGNAPRFGSLDPARLFLADIDGSGPADLIHVRRDGIEIYFNRSGNTFSEPLVIPLPVPYDQLSQISFGDVYGNGTACLILTQLTPTVDHFVYDFCRETKPYLLTGVANQLGSTVEIEYTSSVTQYLEDRREGREWATRLYFPVQVVTRVTRTDEITATRYVTRYRHHDGYYDPQYRQFQGFGFVESWDTEEFPDFTAAVRAGQARDIEERLYVPPVYTRTWYHTGAFLDAGVISAQYAAEYWHGDPDAWILPDSTFGPGCDQDAQTLRQAYAALAGTMLRQEVYGLDGSPAQDDPYTVQENRYAVRLIQPRRGRNAAVFLTYHLETLASEYDRVPSDPRLRQQVALDVDEFGNVCRACQVAYPRRDAPGRPTVPEQRRLMVTLTETDYVNHVEPDRWIGVPFQRRTFELDGLSASDELFTVDGLRVQSDEALAAQIPFGQPFTPGLRQARIFTWDQALYWDEDLNAPLPLGEIAARCLIHHQQRAILPTDLVAERYPGKGDPDELMRGAGYWLSDGYWWNRGLIQYYLDDPAACYLPNRTDGHFDGVDPDGPLNPATTVDFDPYFLLPVAVTQYLTDTITLRVRADNDYHVMLPWRVIDINDNTTEVAFDPFGVVVVSTTYGTEDGQPVGDAPLSDYAYQPDPTFQSVVDDPARYVQDAAAYFFYDLFAWADRRQPPSALGIRRSDYVHAEPATVETALQTGITYSDGLGRIVENRLRTEPSTGAEQRWIVSGQVTYNNKALVTERYLPYFSPGPDYTREPGLLAALPGPTVLHYDPLGRLIRTDTPKGFFSATVYSPWAVTSYDEDDTVLDSTFYQHFPVDPPTEEGKAERAALDMAATFYNTPSVAILDVAGRTVRELVNNLGAVTPADLEPIVAGSGITPQQLWDELVADGYLTVDTIVPERAWVAAVVQPYDPEFRVRFTVRFGDLAAPLLNLLKENGLTTLSVLDAAGNPVRQVDPRLLYTNVTTGTDYSSLRTGYDMTATPLAVHSADAGSRWNLPDVFGSMINAWDGRDYRLTRTFDRLARLVRVEVAPGDTTVEVIEYGETQADPARHNLNGQIYRHYDPAGLITDHAYTITGRVASSTRQVRADDDLPVDWTAAAMADVARQPAYTTGFGYDALDRLLRETAPNGTIRVLSYNIAGQLSGATVSGPLETVIIESVEYDAVGQRTTIRYGNGTRTDYAYEETTLRLVGITTTGGEQTFQELRYTFDPVGNVTHIENRSWEAALCHPQPVSPVSEYGYDALYRLLRSTGRQAVAGTGPSRFVPFCPPGPDRELEDYVQEFGYDDAGNLVLIEHVAPVRETRRFDIAPDSNRLATIPYDANGNPLSLGDLGALEWNYAGALTRIELPGGAGTEICLYDAANTRVLRVERGGSNPSRTVYVGTYQETGERQVASVLDDRTRVCLVEYDMAADRWGLRYQLDDNLGSVAWELDATGAALNYQEYFAYGASAFLAAGSEEQAGGKEFRFSGKELDASAGLYYYGVRYYSPEFGRWLSPDPAGAADGLNLYAFVAGNPTSKIDTNGSVGFWAAWGAYVLGALVTMAVGGIGGIRTGHVRGTASGIFMGTVAGAAGAVVAAGAMALAGEIPTLHSIATVAAFGALASMAGSVAGGTYGEMAMRVTPSTNTRVLGTVGTLTSGLVGGVIGWGVASYFGAGSQPSALISIAAGLGSAVLSSGAHLGFYTEGNVRMNPLALSFSQRGQIRPAQAIVNGQPVVLRPDRLLLVMAPQAEAERRYQNTFQGQPELAYVKNPAGGAGPGIKAYHVVAAHGLHGSVIVSTGPNGDVLQPMSIRDFALYVRQQLAGFPDNVAIKFISCYGANFDLPANAQVLANVTGRKVYAFYDEKSQAYGGPWEKFRPQA
jgi:RHS repeat-associated protein